MGLGGYHQRGVSFLVGVVLVLGGAREIAGQTLQTPLPCPAGVTNPQRIEAADIDGDGALDIVTIGRDGIAVLLQRDHALADPIISEVPADLVAAPMGFVIADFDEDDIPDVVTADYSLKRVTFFRGEGNGHFLPGAGTETVAFTVGNIVAADVSADGHLDLLFTVRAQSVIFFDTFRVLWGDGKGAFAPAGDGSIPIAGSMNLPVACAVANLIDLAVPQVLLLNDRPPMIWTYAGEYRDPAGYVYREAIAYVPAGPAAGRSTGLLPLEPADGDFRVLVFGEKMPPQMLTHTGNGLFTEPQPLQGPDDCADGKVAMIDADDLVDAVLLSHGAVHVARGSDDFHVGASYFAGPDTEGIATGDLDGDGWCDAAAVAPGTNGLYVVKGKGDGSFEAPPLCAVPGPGVSGTASGDFNGDGKPDFLISSERAEAISVLLSKESGELAPGETYPGPYETSAPACADFDGDGKLDFAVGGRWSNTVSIRRGNGTGSFGAEALLELAVSAEIAGTVASDYDGDTFPDIAVLLAADDAVGFLPGDGHGGFGALQVVAVGNKPASAAAVSAGGRTGLVVACAGLRGEGGSVWLVTPAAGRKGSFEAVALAEDVLGGPESIAATDLDADTFPDLVVALAKAGPGGAVGGERSLLVFPGTSDGTFGTAKTAPGGPFPSCIAPFDFNGDGRQDLAVGSSESAEVRILYGRTGGDLERGPAFPAASPASLIAGDYNADGRQDLLVVGDCAYVLVNAPSAAAPFIRGDDNEDGDINLADVVFNLQFQFAQGTAPSCARTLDANDDGAINIADPVRMLNHLFSQGGPLPEPFLACGPDGTEDSLACPSYPHCP
jgi:hypothetical protein